MALAVKVAQLADRMTLPVDLLGGLRRRGIDNDDRDDEPVEHALTWEEIPTVDALHALADRRADRSLVARAPVAPRYRRHVSRPSTSGAAA